ncbi:hypothetical protein IFM12275_11550 [Nocardia sputorum]|nr:hypothetical protein IFM12275_11550 [Nocardia sputorum]
MPSYRWISAATPACRNPPPVIFALVAQRIEFGGDDVCGRKSGQLGAQRVGVGVGAVVRLRFGCQRHPARSLAYCYASGGKNLPAAKPPSIVTSAPVT